MFLVCRFGTIAKGYFSEKGKKGMRKVKWDNKHHMWISTYPFFYFVPLKKMLEKYFQG